jgi:cytochrome c-type biogenesis protein CcmH/NrfG
MREVEALARRAQEQLARSEHGPALESLASALRLAPQLDALWAQLAEVIRCSCG